MSGKPSFTCVICQREISPVWWDNGRHREIAPVCKNCERNYGATPPTQGAFRDRRIATQISALAAALDHEAYRQAHPWR